MNKDVAVWVHGITGRMGKLVADELSCAKKMFLCGGSALHIYDKDQNPHGDITEHNLAEGLRNSDLVIDFSSVDGNEILLRALKHVPENLRPSILIATTGLSQATLEKWQAQKGVRLLIAPNTSLGILVLAQLTKQLASFMPGNKFDIEVVETHHRHKVDSPSGTAKFLVETAECANKKLNQKFLRSGKRFEHEIGVHSIRGGNVFGEHEVRFLGLEEEVYLGHRAFSRSLFSQGAMTLGKWLVDQKPGTYSLFDVDLSR